MIRKYVKSQPVELQVNLTRASTPDLNKTGATATPPSPPTITTNHINTNTIPTPTPNININNINNNNDDDDDVAPYLGNVEVGPTSQELERLVVAARGGDVHGGVAPAVDGGDVGQKGLEEGDYLDSTSL